MIPYGDQNKSTNLYIMNPLFLISSAVNTKFGVFTFEQRLAQTRQTLDSVKTKMPNARTIIIESSGAGLEPQHLTALGQMADFVIDFSTDPQVTGLYNSTDNWDIVKNGTEIMCFLKGFKVLQSRPDLINGYDRIFKLSGRYTLNDQFNPSFYEQENVKDKIVVGKRRDSQFPEHVTQQSWQYMSRLWSYPTVMLPEIIDVYTNSINFFSKRVNEKGYIDIEHLLAKFLNQEKVLEVDTVGVEGNIGPNGLQVKD